MRNAGRLLASGAVLLAGAWALLAQGAADQTIVHHESSVKYEALPGLPDCLTAFVEQGNPAAGVATLLLRMAPDCEVPSHWHTPNETVMVVAGGLSLHVKDARPVAARHGDFLFMPTHHIHSVKCISKDPCEFFLAVDATFDIHYVDRNGDEISAEDALNAVPEPKKPGETKPKP